MSSASAFREHLDQDCTTLCHCWLVVRRDGQTFGFTDHDRSITLDAQTLQPRSGFTQTEARETLRMAVDTVDVEGALSSADLDEEDLAAGLFDGALVTTFLVNWTAPSQHMTLRRAVIGKIVLAEGRFVAQLESVAASLDRPNGRYLRRECDARLGDGRCGVDLNTETYKREGVVVEISAPATVRVSGLGGIEPGWASFGEITWTSGPLAGRNGTVIDHRASPIESELVLAADERMPELGDSFVVVAGCDKQFRTCKTKFNNELNFRGFPHLPGNDAAYGYVTEGAVFDGRALVE